MSIFQLFYFVKLVALLVVIVLGYYHWCFQYWNRKKVPYLKPQIPFGNMTPAALGKQNFGTLIKNLYKKMKTRGWKHGGVFILASPIYLPINLDLIKNILAQDFQYFTDHTLYYNEKQDPLSANLTNLSGSKWKSMRTKLTPTFTSVKMRIMFEVAAECQDNLVKKMDVECGTKKPIDIKDILARFTTDVIASCAFGLNSKPYEEDSPFTRHIQKGYGESTLQRLKSTFCYHYPKLALFLKMCLVPKDTTRFFIEIINEAVKHREENNYVRNDFMQLLIDVKNSDESFTVEKVAAQSYMFFLAGLDTTVALMTFASYELAKNQDVQSRVRNEIGRVLAKHGGKINLDAIQDLKYLQQVIDETLRMYPPIPVATRECVKDYKVPNENLTIEKGTRVFIPIMGIHYDEEYYPEPGKFDPGRFSEENKNFRHGYAHLPFGEGPRICFGKRFGIMIAKLGLSCLIGNYKLTVNRKTIEPLEMEAKNLVLSAEGGIWLNVEKL